MNKPKSTEFMCRKVEPLVEPLPSMCKSFIPEVRNMVLLLQPYNLVHVKVEGLQVVTSLAAAAQ